MTTSTSERNMKLVLDYPKETRKKLVYENTQSFNCKCPRLSWLPFTILAEFFLNVRKVVHQS